MPRTNRVTPGGMVFHVLNRGVGRMRLFDSDADYLAFENILEETLVVQPMRLLSYCLMPNHWHFVLWPKEDGDLAAFMQRLTVTHVTRWQSGTKSGLDTDTSIKDASSRFPFRRMNTFSRSCATSSATHCGQGSSGRPSDGAGRVCGAASRGRPAATDPGRVAAAGALTLGSTRQ